MKAPVSLDLVVLLEWRQSAAWDVLQHFDFEQVSTPDKMDRFLAEDGFHLHSRGYYAQLLIRCAGLADRQPPMTIPEIVWDDRRLRAWVYLEQFDDPGLPPLEERKVIPLYPHLPPIGERTVISLPREVPMVADFWAWNELLMLCSGLADPLLPSYLNTCAEGAAVQPETPTSPLLNTGTESSVVSPGHPGDKQGRSIPFKG